jgi:hypothetical protein
VGSVGERGPTNVSLNVAVAISSGGCRASKLRVLCLTTLAVVSFWLIGDSWSLFTHGFYDNVFLVSGDYFGRRILRRSTPKTRGADL